VVVKSLKRGKRMILRVMPYINESTKPRQLKVAPAMTRLERTRRKILACYVRGVVNQNEKDKTKAANNEITITKAKKKKNLHYWRKCNVAICRKAVYREKRS